MLVIVVMGSMGMPGDGDHAMRAAAPYLYATLALSALVLLGCLVSSALAIALRRQRAGGVVAVALLGVLALVILLPMWASRSHSLVFAPGASAPIWQAAGVQG